MATNFLTPNMNLLVPVVGAELSPTWAQDLNTSLGTIDSHNHSSGQGVQINPSGININASLPFNGNSATGLSFVNITPQGTGIGTPTNASVYVSGVDFYFKDGGGNAIQLTKSGGPNAGIGNISGLPSTPSGGAGLAWLNSSSAFQFTQDSGSTGPSIDGGAYILRYGGSYPSPSGNAVVLAASSSLSGTYQLTLPAALPGTSGAMLTFNTSGTGSFTNVDNATLQWSSGIISVKALGIGAAQLGTGAVGASQIAANAVTAAKIANATITGTQMASSVNLPGNTVAENSKWVVVASTNPSATSLAIIRGTIQTDGTTLAGEGFSTVNNSAGVYTVTWSNAFSDTASVVVAVNSSGSWSAPTAQITGGSSVVITAKNLSGTNTPASLSFVAIGQR